MKSSDLPSKAALKAICLGSVFAGGLAIGWEVGRTGRVEVPRNFPTRKVAIRVQHDRNKRPDVDSLAKGLFLSDDKTIQKSIQGLDSSNWLTYLNEATSKEAEDRGFLETPSVESLLLLRRLGDVAPSEAIKFLIEKNLEGCLAGVVDGWSKVDPASAFTWLQSHQNELRKPGKEESLRRANAKAAGALIAVDPQAVLSNKDFQLSTEDAVEMARHVGFQKLSELLAARWEIQSGDYQENRTLGEEFSAFAMVAYEDIRRKIPNGSERINRQGAFLSKMLENPRLNPGVRHWIEAQPFVPRSCLKTVKA